MNAFLNMTKQICAVIFPLITVPYVSRILQRENYGKYNFGNSIVSYFILIAGLGIVNYAIREGARIRNDRKKLNRFANEVFTINIYSTIIAYILLFIIVHFSAKLKLYQPLIFVQSLSIILTTLGADWVNSIFEDYLYITIRYIIIQCLAIVGLFIFVKGPEDYIKYAAITVFASAGGNILNIFYIRKYVHLIWVKNCNFFTHIKSIMLLFFNSIATTIYVNSDTTILGFLQNEASVGIYSLSTKIYLVIKQVLNAIITVSLPRISAQLANGDESGFIKLSNKIMDALCTIIFPTIVGLFILSKECILIIGGEQYVEGVNALRILSISLGFAVLASFYCCAIMLPFRQEKMCLMASTISAVINIVLNFLIIPVLNYNGAALTTLIAEAVAFFVYWRWSKKYPKVGCSRSIILSTVVGCFGIIIVCFVVKRIMTGLYLTTACAVFFSIIIYFLIQIIMKNNIILDIIRTIGKRVH